MAAERKATIPQVTIVPSKTVPQSSATLEQRDRVERKNELSAKVSRQAVRSVSVAPAYERILSFGPFLENDEVAGAHVDLDRPTRGWRRLVLGGRDEARLADGSGAGGFRDQRECYDRYPGLTQLHS